METPASVPFIAAMVYINHGEGDTLLADFAFYLRDQGWRVNGLIQRPIPDAQHEKRMELIDVDSGQRFSLFQNLGTDSHACSVNTNSVAAASTSLRTAITQKVDLVVVNRFGALEAKGGGFSLEMLALMSESIPLLTLVSAQYLDDWRHFTGDAGVELPLQRGALEFWFNKLQLERKHHKTA